MEQFKEMISEMKKENKTAEEIKKAIADKYFAEDAVKAEDIVKDSGEVFVITDSFEKSLEEVVAPTTSPTDIPVWGGIPSANYEYKKEDDMTLEQKQNAEHVELASGEMRPVVIEE